MMTFIEAIQALEQGKTLRVDGADSPVFQLAAVGARRQLVQVWSDGSWQLTRLEYRGPADKEHWSIVE